LIKCKCKGCLFRHLNCHSECKDYKEYIDELTAIKELKHKFNSYYNYQAYNRNRIYSENKVKRHFMKK